MRRYYQIRIISAGNHQANFGLQVAHEGFPNQPYSGFPFNDVAHDGRSGIIRQRLACEDRELFILLRKSCSSQNKDQQQRQNSKYASLQDYPLPSLLGTDTITHPSPVRHPFFSVPPAILPLH
ncbi:MAG: hypothetical protein ACOX53_00195 [Limnochordia bacterium]